MKQQIGLKRKTANIRLTGTLLLGSAFVATLAVQAQTAPVVAPTTVNPIYVKDAVPPKDVVDLDLLTWPELYKEIHEQGKTTVIIFNGGTEQRGPQNIVGGHTIIAHDTADAIARKLGNALVAPILPFSPNRVDPNKPGTIGITPDVYAALNQQVAEQLIRNGFKNVVLIGDHGGGQKELKELAAKLDAQYSPQGVRVIYSDGPYTQANDEFDAWLAKNGYPASSHAGIPDTSELLYLEGSSDRYVRKGLLPTALGDPPRAGFGGEGGGSRPTTTTPTQTTANSTSATDGTRPPRQRPDPSVPRINNGIVGDARRSTPDLGKRFIDLKVDNGVTQIKQLLSQPPQQATGSVSPAPTGR